MSSTMSPRPLKKSTKAIAAVATPASSETSSESSSSYFSTGGGGDIPIVDVGGASFLPASSTPSPLGAPACPPPTVSSVGGTVLSSLPPPAAVGFGGIPGEPPPPLPVYGRSHLHCGGAQSSIEGVGGLNVAPIIRRTTSSGGGKKKCALGTTTVDYLKSWMMSPEHVEHPYPTEEEKARIMNDTGIELKQLTNWFVNNRKRYWKPRVEELRRQGSLSLSGGRVGLGVGIGVGLGVGGGIGGVETGTSSGCGVKVEEEGERGANIKSSAEGIVNHDDKNVVSSSGSSGSSEEDNDGANAGDVMAPPSRNNKRPRPSFTRSSNPPGGGGSKKRRQPSGGDGRNGVGDSESSSSGGSDLGSVVADAFDSPPSQSTMLGYCALPSGAAAIRSASDGGSNLITPSTITSGASPQTPHHHHRSHPPHIPLPSSRRGHLSVADPLADQADDEGTSGAIGDKDSVLLRRNPVDVAATSAPVGPGSLAVGAGLNLPPPGNQLLPRPSSLSPHPLVVQSSAAVLTADPQESAAEHYRLVGRNMAPLRQFPPLTHNATKPHPTPLMPLSSSRPSGGVAPPGARNVATDRVAPSTSTLSVRNCLHGEDPPLPPPVVGDFAHSCHLGEDGHAHQPCALCAACRDWNLGEFCPWDLTVLIGDGGDAADDHLHAEGGGGVGEVVPSGNNAASIINRNFRLPSSASVTALSSADGGSVVTHGAPTSSSSFPIVGNGYTTVSDTASSSSTSPMQQPQLCPPQTTQQPQQYPAHRTDAWSFGGESSFFNVCSMSASMVDNESSWD